MRHLLMRLSILLALLLFGCAALPASALEWVIAGPEHCDVRTSEWSCTDEVIPNPNQSLTECVRCTYVMWHGGGSGCSWSYVADVCAPTVEEEVCECTPDSTIAPTSDDELAP